MWIAAPKSPILRCWPLESMKRFAPVGIPCEIEEKAVREDLEMAFESSMNCQSSKICVMAIRGFILGNRRRTERFGFFSSDSNAQGYFIFVFRKYCLNFGFSCNL